MSDLDRFKWPAPSDEYFRRNIVEGENNTVGHLIERYRFIWEEFGPPTDMLLVGGIPSMFALDELKRSYAYGNFMATVLLAQAFIEQSIGGSYTMAGEDDIANKPFSALINEAQRDGQITPRLAQKFHMLREMRNPYAHHIGGTGKRSYMGRLFEAKPPAPEELVVSDAKFAIRTIVDYLRHNSPNWNPSNYQWDEEDI